jgi:dUTPase
MVFKGVKKAEWVIVETLPLSRRGEGGFGSTGINNLDSNDL